MERVVRTHRCGDLTSKDLGQTVTLCGWVAKRRDHGGVVFIDLRDRYGLTQVVFDPETSGGKIAHEKASVLRTEYVIQVQGEVRKRPEGQTNEKLTTGEIEIAVTELEIFSKAQTPPFPIEEETEVNENVRLKYRYLDLRRPMLQKNLVKRSQITQAIRKVLVDHDFIEVETPLLYKSTPEGARDFIVPSRLSPGEFFALPQSPQTLKQLLMIGGMDRYFQVAKCFRDEDLRADRQPEFSQIDIEMSFVDQEVLFPMMEAMMAKIWKEQLGVEVKTPFLRMPYEEAMNRFGSDKPDIRFGLELQDLSEIFSQSDFKVFSQALQESSRGGTGSIRAIVVPQKAKEFSRKDLDELQKFTSQYGAKGLLWIKVNQGEELQSPAAKFFTDTEKKQLISSLSLKEGDLVLCVADPKNKVVFDALGALRLEVAEKIELVPKEGAKDPRFLWVTDFPLLEYDDETRRYYALHHPFTSPKKDQLSDFLEGKNLDRMAADAYDLVLNGVELGGGSLRIYQSEVQQKMFEILGMNEEEVKSQFGFFIDALKYGTPPHGGIALGLDRLVALVCGVKAIRDVMAFPKTQKGTDLMATSPSVVSPEQLAEVGISVIRMNSGDE
ncbi:MAG: aspartate--tRNA ligase [Bdellovibrionaceae bacterium]|nr:aspartate--tRNA ligase [Pseudobdellovibrionaceae bacterium]